MKKVLVILLSLALLCVPLAACGGDSGGGDTPAAGGGGGDAPAAGGGGDAPAAGGSGDVVVLTVWGGEEDQAMLKQICDAFEAANADRATFDIRIGVESESTAKDTILTDPLAAADVFAFADDQVADLYRAGALQEIVLNTDAVIAASMPSAVEAASVDGVLYAYPLTADNGYFMFYDASYFTEDDVKTMDRMLEVAAEAGKQITMEVGGAWYLYSFFKGAGLEMYMLDDGSNFCNWNESPGTAVVQGVMDIAAHPGFISLGDGEFVTGIKDGSIIAGINGPWNSNNAMEAWGDNYAAAKLPTFTVDGQQVQMASFSGYKLIGVNAFSQQTGWAMELGEWISNYDNQMLRFEMRRQGPANLQAAASPEVQADPALAAISAQSAYATPQRVGGNYWSAAGSLGQIIVEGNPSGTDLQELLDNAVAGITAPPG